MMGVGVGGGDGEISRERRAVILIGAHNEPGFPPKRGFNLPFSPTMTSTWQRIENWRETSFHVA